jgi:hypothetical protein
LGSIKSGLIRQVTSKKRLNSYEIFYDRTRKRLSFNRGDSMVKFECRILSCIYGVTAVMTVDTNSSIAVSVEG